MTVHLHMEFDLSHEDLRAIEDDFHTPIVDREACDDN